MADSQNSSQNRTPSLVSPKGNYINGSFKENSDRSGTIVSKSPADFTDVLGEFHYAFKDIDDAVESARTAFKSWKKTSRELRFELLNKYKEILKKIEPRLSEAIAREIGKPLWESKQEVVAMVNKVEITLQEGLTPIQDYEIQNIMENTKGACRYRPHGVFAVLGPFNFPGHLANGHIVPALATGNTIVFKPSEKASAVGQIMAEAMDEAGFPKGVFNLVHGNGEVGRRLSVHEGIDGVLFTGSYDVGLKIKHDTLQQYWKLLALEMGGKNASIVDESSNLDFAIYETLTSAFVTAGQRCTATSRIFVHEKLYDEFVNKFHERAKAFTIGHPLDNPFMGPLIDLASIEKYLKFLGIATREGCEVIMRGKRLELDYDGAYVAPSICLVKNNQLTAVKKSVYQQSEVFGPNVAIYSFKDVEEAIALSNATLYGLVTSVYTTNRNVYEKCLEDLRMGLVNWNRSTVGASSRLPFGGLKRSGNHFPTAVSAATYCTYPVASLEVAEPKPIGARLPGLNWV